MALLPDLLQKTVIPDFYPVKQSFTDDSIADIPKAVAETLDRSGLKDRLPKGGNIAIGVGSRGVANIPAIAAATAAWFKRHGCNPFIIPCMGSHGGATGPGQIKVLADLGVTEQSAGCPIRATMDVVQVGQLDNGLPVYMDAIAWDADGVFVINRIKPHTSFTGPNESGLVKMLTIGLGKQKGADAAHTFGNDHFATTMPAMTRMVLAKKSTILGGLATVENELDKTCVVEAVPAENLVQRDAELLLLAKKRLPALPAGEIDLLLVDYMGKNISGSGMDTNITGRHGGNRTGGPKVTRLCVFRLTEEAKGNATGMGMADIIPRQLADSINYEYTYANVITSNNVNFVRMPMVLDTDELVVRCGVKTCTAPKDSLRGIRIRDTLSLSKLLVTRSVAETLRGDPRFSVGETPLTLAFDASGTLDKTIWDTFI